MEREYMNSWIVGVSVTMLYLTIFTFRLLPIIEKLIIGSINLKSNYYN